MLDELPPQWPRRGSLYGQAELRHQLPRDVPQRHLHVLPHRLTLAQAVEQIVSAHPHLTWATGSVGVLDPGYFTREEGLHLRRSGDAQRGTGGYSLGRKRPPRIHEDQLAQRGQGQPLVHPYRAQAPQLRG